MRSARASSRLRLRRRGSCRHRRREFASSRPSPDRPKSSFSLADLLFAEGQIPRGARRVSQARRDVERGPTGARAPGWRHQVGASDRASSTSAREEAEALDRERRASQSRRAPFYGDALWASGLFDEAERAYRDALARRRTIRARPARPCAGARGAQPAGRGDGRGAGSAGSRRATARSTTRSARSTSGCTASRKRPARSANYVNLLPNRDRSDKAALGARPRSGSSSSFKDGVPFEIRSERATSRCCTRCRSGSFGQGRRAGQGQRAPRTGLRPRHRRRSRRSSSRPTAQRRGRRCRSPTTLSAGVGDVGLRGLQLARIDALQIGTLKMRNVPCLIKNPPLGGLPDARGRELLAAGARPVDDDRLRARKLITIGTPASRRAGRRRAAAAHAPPGDGARHGRTVPPGQLRRRHRRRSHLDQPGDGRQRSSRRPAVPAHPAARSTARRAGTATRS